MPAICESISTKLSENLTASFKRKEKENFENHLTPTAKQVLSAKIEYEPIASYSNSILSSLQTKYIVLKPNQSALSSNGINPKSQQCTTNGKHSVTSSTSQSQLPQPKRTLFPRENVQVGWSAMNGRWSTGCGFNNIGNTCYLNSALQAFFHVPALANWLINDKEHREKCSPSGFSACTICAMAITLVQSQRGGHSITPSHITNKLQQICKHLHIGRQEDAHEFLRYLIEQMEKNFLNRFKNSPGFKDMDQYSKETTALNQIIGGYLRSTVSCGACRHDSITFQHFMDLPLDIRSASTLIEALDSYFAKERLEECGYKCESCKKKVSATKKFSLERAPVVLCIQLKRFNVMGGKLGKQIQIFKDLDLSKYLSSPGDPQNCKYQLTSMVTHLGGSASGGHYTAIGLAPNGCYYQFDDSCVTQISTEQALRTNSYVLFYELTNRKQQNGHTTVHQIHQNEHTYSKSASSTSTSSFATPKLPFVPHSVMKQNSHLRQKENETTPPARPSTSKVTNGTTKVATQLFPAVKANGKREASSDESDEEVPAKKARPSLPSLPRLTTEEANVTPKLPLSPAASPSPPTKRISLVPYETDDEDDEPTPPTNGVANGVKKSEPVSFCRTSSGVFVETDLNENGPSKAGSTIVTKASQLNGAANGHVNGKTNGYHVKRGDDTIQQLTKLTHSGYGSSEVVSWNNTPTNMNREVDRDQSEEKKRQHEDEEDMEMDAGRVKKVKQRIGYPQPAAKLPNPFQEQQNSHYQNGNYHSPSKNFSDYRRYQNGNGYNRNGNGNGHYRNQNHNKHNGGPHKFHNKNFQHNNQNGYKNYPNKNNHYNNNPRR